MQIPAVEQGEIKGTDEAGRAAVLEEPERMEEEGVPGGAILLGMAVMLEGLERLWDGGVSLERRGAGEVFFRCW